MELRRRRGDCRSFLDRGGGRGRSQPSDDISVVMRSSWQTKAEWLDVLLPSLSSSSNMSQEEDGRTQRVEEASEEEEPPRYNRLGRTGPAKSQTQRVMEECERSGKTAPSVFGGAKPGAQTGGTAPSAGPTNK